MMKLFGAWEKKMVNLKGKKIVVVGVSKSPEKFGHKIFRDLLQSGFDVKGVGKEKGIILQQRIYSSIGKIGEKADIIITVIPPLVTEKIVEEAIKLGIDEIWMQPGSESKTAIERAMGAGIKTTSNRCIMVDAGIW